MAVRSNTYEKAVKYLEKIYTLISQEYFCGELEEITLTVQESVRSYGHVSVDNTWFTDDKSMKELNISASYLKRDISEIVTTLIHECSHIWNMKHDIKDTSNNNVYHNKKFKQTAEERGKLKLSGTKDMDGPSAGRRRRHLISVSGTDLGTSRSGDRMRPRAEIQKSRQAQENTYARAAAARSGQQKI